MTTRATTYDLVIHGGTLIDPARSIAAERDVATTVVTPMTSEVRSA